MEKEKLYDKWTATGLETIKACVEDKIANYCELNKKQCQEVLNLIENQQKEIKELKEKEKNLLKQLKDSEKELLEVTQNVVSKDKIREKIKEYKGLKEIDKMAYEEQIKPLQELLKEK